MNQKQIRMDAVRIGGLQVGPGQPPLLIAGPCVLEDLETALFTAEFMAEAARTFGFSYMFKASFDKANRTSLRSFRGPGLREGLEMLAAVRERLSVPVISDIHTPAQAEAAGEALDCIQIPALLCRQTDLLVAAARTGRPVNIKKGQFLAPWDMQQVVNKLTAVGNHRLLLTDRGTMFGYNNLVVDFRAIPIMQNTGWPVIFDATHSVQLPGGAGTHSGGQREFAPLLAKAGAAAGADGIFLEVHPNPDQARCDGPNALALDALPDLLSRLKAIREIVTRG